MFSRIIMVSLAKNCPIDKARIMAAEAVTSGKALEVFRRWMKAQGAKDVSFIEAPDKLCPAERRRTVAARESGYIVSKNAETIGKAAALLGAGRETLDDRIDPSAGIMLLRKTGDYVRAGDPVAELYTSSAAAFEEAETAFFSALRFGAKEPRKKPLIYGIV